MNRSTRNAITVCGFLAILAVLYRSVFTGHLLAGWDVFLIFFPDSAFLLESRTVVKSPPLVVTVRNG